MNSLGFINPGLTLTPIKDPQTSPVKIYLLRDLPRPWRWARWALGRTSCIFPRSFQRDLEVHLDLKYRCYIYIYTHMSTHHIMVIMVICVKHMYIYIYNTHMEVDHVGTCRNSLFVMMTRWNNLDQAYTEYISRWDRIFYGRAYHTVEVIADTLWDIIWLYIMIMTDTPRKSTVYRCPIIQEIHYTIWNYGIYYGISMDMYLIGVFIQEEMFASNQEA